MNQKRLLIINGSNRKKGTSYSFGRTLKILAEELGNKAEIIHVIDYFDGRKSMESIKNNITQSDIIAFIAPLYVDALPYPAIWFLENLSSDLKEELRGRSLFAIGQCGFPDITRNEPIINSCRCFAYEMDMKWLGGLSYGGGAILNGELLENLGKEGNKLISAFRLTLEEILDGKIIPSKAQEMITVKIPKIFYRPLAAYLNYKIRKMGRQHGNKNLDRKVYLEE